MEIKSSRLSSVKNVRAISTEKLQAARAAEQDKEVEKAIKLYEDLISMKYPDPFPFQRLMILYRKEKRYKDEIRVINAGIEAMTRAVIESRERTLAGHGNLNKVKQLSAGFLKSAGYKNEAADLLPEPVPSWAKRKKLVEQKSRSKSKN
jgi:hypothetical protein